MKNLARILSVFVFTMSFSTCVNAEIATTGQTSQDILSNQVIESELNSDTAKEISVTKTPETALFKTDIIEFDKKPVEFSTVIHKDRIYVKLRDLCYNLKCNIEVDNSSRVINIIKNPESVQENVYADKEKVLDPIKVNIDISDFIIKSDNINTYMESIIYQGRTYIPVRFFSEIFEKKVDWLADQRKVLVSTLPPEIIGYVNEQALYKKDFDFLYEPQYLSLLDTNAAPSEDEIKNLKSSIFDTLVLYTVLLQKTAKENIQLTEIDYQNINSTISSYISMNNGPEGFRKILEENKITLYQFSNNLRDNALINKLAEVLVKDVTPSEEAIQKYYDDNKYLFNIPEQVRAKHILFSISDLKTGIDYDDVKKAEIKKKAEEVLAEIKAGANFDELMNKYSEDPGTQSYPDGYTFSRGQMVKPFEDASFSMNVGEISSLVETSFGYHIIKLEEELPEKEYTLNEVRENIIMEISPQEKQLYFNNFVEKSKSESVIVNNLK